MNKFCKVVLLVAALLAGSVPAFAGDQEAGAEKLSLKERKMVKKAEEDLKSQVESTKKECAMTNLDASLELDKAALKKIQEGNYSIHGFCAYALSGMRTVCRDELGKKSIQEGIEKVVCRYPGKRALSVENKTLTLDIDLKAPNYDQYVVEQLENTL